MPIDETLNKILKEMWRLDEKLNAGEGLTEDEKTFYNQHLGDITSYYFDKDMYWRNKKIIN